MRILFLESHPMWIHGLPNGFRDLGHEVKISGSLRQADVVQGMIADFGPDLIVTMGWGPENDSPSKQKLIRRYVEKVGVPHIYWATEDPTHTRRFTIPYLHRVKPDFVFTICRPYVEFYRRELGIPAAHLDFGFHASVHRSETDDRYRCTIAVVANAYAKQLTRYMDEYPDHYRFKSMLTLIRPLVANGMRIDFWGRDWDQAEPLLEYPIPKEWIHGYLDYTEASKVYSSADIVIGLQNQLTQVTQRTYETLGSGGFLLTSNTPAVSTLVRHGEDLILSASPEETVNLVDYYLQNPASRKRIRLQGQMSVMKHSYEHRARYVMDTLHEENILASERGNCSTFQVGEGGRVASAGPFPVP